MSANIGERKGRRWLQGALALALGIVLSMAVAEIALRVLGIEYPIMVEPDPVTGSRLIPGTRAWYTREGRAFIEVNAAGYRDREHPLAKPPGEWRFAILGDSYSEALQVSFDETFWNVAAERLASCPALAGRTPVPVNFGLSGQGTAQQLETLRQRAWDYDPDLVLLAFVPNDFEDNSPDLGGRDDRPYYVLDEEGRLELDDAFLRSPRFQRRMSEFARWRRRLGNASRTLQLVVEMRRVLHRRSLAQRQPPTREKGESTYGPPTAPRWVDAWEVTEALVAEVARRVEQRGRDFLLVAVSSPHQVHPDREYREQRLREVGGVDLLYWNRRLGRLADREGIEYVSLVEPFQEHAAAHDRCLHGFANAHPCDGHWNEHGHALAGRIVADAICARLESGVFELREDQTGAR